MTRVRTHYLLELALVAGAFVGAARLGYLVTIAGGAISPVWPPAGVAVGLLAVRGVNRWPGVAAGALVAAVAYPSGGPLWTDLVAPLGSPIEAVAVVLLLRRAGLRRSIERSADVLALVAAAAAGAVPAALWGAGIVVAGGGLGLGGYARGAALWWAGDVTAIVLIAPLLLAWSSLPARPPRRRLVEGVALAAAVSAVAWLAFVGTRGTLMLVVLALAVWTTTRFGLRGATLVTVVVFGCALVASIQGKHDFGGGSPLDLSIEYELAACVQALALYLLAASAGRQHGPREAPGKALALQAVVLGAVVFGVGDVVRGFALHSGDVPPAQQLSVPVLITTATLAVVVAAQQRVRAVWRAARADWRLYLAGGVAFAGVVGFLALANLEVGTSIAVAAASPTAVFVLLYVAVGGRRPPPAVQALAAVAVLVGIATLAEVWSIRAAAAGGVVLALLCAAARGAYFVQMKAIRRRADALGALLAVNAIACVVLVSVTLATGGYSSALLRADVVGPLLAVSVMKQTLPFLVYAWALPALGAEKVAIVATASPAVTAALGRFWPGEPLGAVQVLGILVVVAATALASREPRRRPELVATLET